MQDKYPLIVTDVVARAHERIRFKIPKPSSERFKNFPWYYGSVLWDKLDPETQKIDAYPSFKSRIKQLS